MSIAFLICTEPGRLEGQSILLAESIRKFAGSMKDTPIYSFHPRVGNPIAPQTQKKFDQLGVIHQQIPLNVEFTDYYLANKPFVCAYAEQELDADILVFIDSDQCIFQEPSEFLLPEGYTIGLRPEYGKGIGSSGKGDKQDDYWRTLYELLDVKTERFITTPIGQQEIRAYWNSGLVAVRREVGIFTAWKQNFEKIMRLKISPLQGDYMIEQSSLSVTVCALNANVHTFSSTYSYPLPLHNRLSSNTKLKSFDQIVSIHYFNMFFFSNWETRLGQIKNIDFSSTQYTWLCDKLSAQKLPRQTWEYRYRLWKTQIQRKLKLIFGNPATN
jgi:hypothetical protein